MPLPVTALPAVRMVAAGEFQCAAIDESGGVYTWGVNLDGALGRPAQGFESPPGRVPGMPAIRSVALGMGYMLALTQDDSVYAWGSNAAGQLGVGHLKTVDVPIRIAIAQRVHAVAAIGNPERFFTGLQVRGIEVIPHPFADHHVFSAGDLAFGDGLPVLMTEKDAIKCVDFAGENVWCVPVSAELPAEFVEALVARLRPREAAPSAKKS
jgi:hypothetical protein